jgi:fatty acid desaturase
VTKSPGGPTASEGYSWSARRAKEEPFLAALVVLFQLVLSLAVYIFYGLSFALLTFGVITLALIPFYAAYTYRLTRDTLQVQGPFYYTEYRWTEFDTWRLTEDEVRMTFKGQRKSRVLVLYAPHNVHDALQAVQRYMPRGSLEEDRRL